MSTTQNKNISHMTNYKLKLNQIREVLGMPVKLERATLADGTIVEVEKLEIGFPVSIVAEDGSMTPAPEGEHTLENGMKIKVDANGVIAEIMPAAEPVAVAAEEEPVIEEVQEMELPEGVAEVISKVIEEKMAEKVEETMKMVMAAVEEIATDVASVKEEMGAMKEKMQKFAKSPAGNPVPKATIEKADKTIDSIDARLASINELKKSLKK
jgi:hypothetical protein